jgi:thiol-disulfide isomerase/thioredoxin
VNAGRAGDSLQAINDEYNRQLLQLERQRLERLAQLGARQAPKDAAETYEQLFRLAIANNLFVEAEPAADRVLKASGIAPSVQFLAHTINVIAEADRGAFDESLADLRAAMGERAEQRKRSGAPVPSLDTSALLALCEAYYQRLMQGDQFDVARKAFRLIQQETTNAGVKAYCAGRLERLDMVGKPAPQIEGTDLDGKPVNLANLKGNAILVVFWASWCLPSSTEIGWLDEIENSYHAKGLRILGINVDASSSGSAPAEHVMTNIRRFVLDHNVRWPNLINGSGAQDFAKAYGITDIPSSALIGRDGSIIHLDLGRKNLDSVIARTVAR